MFEDETSILRRRNEEPPFEKLHQVTTVPQPQSWAGVAKRGPHLELPPLPNHFEATPRRSDQGSVTAAHRHGNMTPAGLSPPQPPGGCPHGPITIKAWVTPGLAPPPVCAVLIPQDPPFEEQLLYICTGSMRLRLRSGWFPWFKPQCGQTFGGVVIVILVS